MIEGWVSKGNMKKLTRPEAMAFIYFMLMEKRRHEKDIREIEEAVNDVSKHFGIRGLE